MIQINVYLNFDGNCEAAFNFYKSVFGGEFSWLGRLKDMPSKEPIPADQENKIMHVSLPIGNTTLMGSDNYEGFQQQHVKGNNFSVSVNIDDRAEADRIFNALAADGRTDMPMQETFWGAYFGMCADQFGISWMVNCELAQKGE